MYRNKINHDGRIIIPYKVRKVLGINPNDEFETTHDGENIILKKITTGCIFCHSTENLFDILEQVLCLNCIKNLKHIKLKEIKPHEQK